MARRPLTLDTLSVGGRRGTILTILRPCPMAFSDICRAYDPARHSDRVERCRIRSALDDLRRAGWAVVTEWGWTLTADGVEAHRAFALRVDMARPDRPRSAA